MSSAARWVVLTKLASGSFENVWTDTDAAGVSIPSEFETKADAEVALDEFMADAKADGMQIVASDYAVALAA